MGLVLGCIWYFFTAGTVFVALAISTVFVALLISTAFNAPYYGPYEAFGDVQFFWLALVIHDRFVGAYAKALRKVAKYINKAEKAATASYDFDEFDDQQ